MAKFSAKDLSIRRAIEADIDAAAKVHQLAFPRQTYAMEWLTCVFRSFPKSQLFVAELAGAIVGLIFWTEKSGFRKEALIELEQIAVHPEKQSQGIGSALILQSLPLVAEKTSERGAELRHVIVNTRVDNYSQALYKKTMDVKPVATISGLFSADEVFLLAKNISLAEIQSRARQSKGQDQ